MSEIRVCQVDAVFGGATKGPIVVADTRTASGVKFIHLNKSDRTIRNIFHAAGRSYYRSEAEIFSIFDTVADIVVAESLDKDESEAPELEGTDSQSGQCRKRKRTIKDVPFVEITTPTVGPVAGVRMKALPMKFHTKGRYKSRLYIELLGVNLAYFKDVIDHRISEADIAHRLSADDVAHRASDAEDPPAPVAQEGDGAIADQDDA